jgi:hypothetical protein
LARVNSAADRPAGHTCQGHLAEQASRAACEDFWGGAPRLVAGNAGNATAASLIAGAAVVQPGGTDNAPTEAA